MQLLQMWLGTETTQVREIIALQIQHVQIAVQTHALKRRQVAVAGAHCAQANMCLDLLEALVRRNPALWPPCGRWGTVRDGATA